MSENHHKVIIIGSGPAGFTAALYNARANLNPVIFEGMQPGGQLTITTDVDNYPGFENGIMGPELMDIMRKQVQRFGTKTIYSEITEVDFSQRPFKLQSYEDEYTADAVIVVTVASSSVLPSVSSLSSLVSSTVVPAGLSPSAKTLLLKPPVSIASCSIT